MRRALLVLLLAFPAAAQTLTEAIDRAVANPKLDRAIWAIDVEDDAGNVLYSRNAATLVMPASNRKIFAAASIINCLGTDHRFTTELWLDGNGNLVMRGSGDPSLGGRWAYDRDTVFASFVSAVRARGIAEVNDIVADVSQFDRVTLPGTWKIGNLGADYAAPVDALAYNENVVGVAVEDCARPVVATDPNFIDAVETVTCGPGEPDAKIDVVSDENVVRVTGPMTKKFTDLPAVASPGLYAAQALRDALRRDGIKVRGALRLNIAPVAWRERIATIESPPLWQLLTVMLKVSQNLYAEMLFKATAGNYRGAWILERDFLTSEVGIDPAEFRFVDGSGLSSDDLVTARAIVSMFRWMNAPQRRGLDWLMLATPGEEGTLSKRLLPLAARFRGKTGTISGVNALSGIVRGNNGGYRYFAVVLNHSIADWAAATKAIDDVVAAVSDF